MILADFRNKMKYFSAFLIKQMIKSREKKHHNVVFFSKQRE